MPKLFGKPPQMGMRKYRSAQQATAISTVIVLLYMWMQYKIAIAQSTPFVVDGGNMLLLTGAAVSPMLWYMGMNVWTHAVQAKGSPSPLAPEEPAPEKET